MVARFFQALVALFQVLLMSIGLLPVDMSVNYGGEPYAPPAVETEMVLAEDGRSDFSIALPADADACMQTAARELADYFEKISGASLPVVTADGLADGEKAILLTVDPDPEGGEILGEEDFRITSDGTRLSITGGGSRGTLYGVYTFLEEYLGVRWFTPTLERVPETDRVVVDAAIDRTVRPSFSVRRNDCAGTNDAYRARTKMNVSFWREMPDYGGALTYVIWDVTLDRLVPDALFNAHPEYFAMDEKGNRTTDHVCLSNPEVFEIAVENARAAIASCERDSKFLHIGQKDNTNYCHCPDCEALYEKYGAVSAPTILFTNALAERLEPEYPDFTFTFYAYNETDRPPTAGDLRCRENVAPVLCGLHKACRSHPLTECGAVDGDDSLVNLYGKNEPQISEDFKTWTTVADRTYIYDYTINFLNTAQFFSNLETMQSTMKYMHDIGITGYIYNCGDGHEAAFNELRNYLLHKLQWDVDCDVKYHMNDFLSAYYGADAAPYIKEILDIQTSQIRATAHAFDFDWHYQSGYYPPLTVHKLDGLWEKALSVEISDEERFRVETADLSWEYFKANLFLGKYSLANPLRMQENEALYDAFKVHGINRVCSFGLI
ncbi:MAG: DUF4838 domain-containing protein, partial [Clostridia bacterium]|nr:DUF4838 domain-containing protein [Clostridia bacterium]